MSRGHTACSPETTSAISVIANRNASSRSSCSAATADSHAVSSRRASSSPSSLLNLPQRVCVGDKRVAFDQVLGVFRQLGFDVAPAVSRSGPVGVACRAVRSEHAAAPGESRTLPVDGREPVPFRPAYGKPAPRRAAARAGATRRASSALRSSGSAAICPVRSNWTCGSPCLSRSRNCAAPLVGHDHAIDREKARRTRHEVETLRCVSKRRRINVPSMRRFRRSFRMAASTPQKLHRPSRVEQRPSRSMSENSSTRPVAADPPSQQPATSSRGAQRRDDCILDVLAIGVRRHG